MSNAPAWVLVTGMPRGGTTVVGQMLALGQHTVTLHEPLNGDAGLRKVVDYFDHIDRPGDQQACAKIDDTVSQLVALKGLRFKPGLFQRDTGLRGAVKRVTGGRVINSWRRTRFDPFKKYIIWKDPFAAFMVGRLAEKHGIPSIVTVRNPWATAASFRRMGWGMELSHVRAATSGLPRYGVPEDALCPPKDDAVGNATAIWVMLYSKVMADIEVLKNTPNVPSVTLLDLDQAIAAPVETYANLYQTLGLPWSQAVEARIAGFYAPKSGGGRDMPKEGIAHDTNRDPATLNDYWKKVLTPEEEARVTRMSGALWETVQAQLPQIVRQSEGPV